MMNHEMNDARRRAESERETWQRVFEEEIAAKRRDMARDVMAEMNRARQEAENV